MLDNAVSHDKITRFLSGNNFNSKDLWRLVKPDVRSAESEDGVLIFDDTIQEKQWTDENEIISWHFDHSKNRTIKGVNILNCLYNIDDVNIPVSFEIIRKTLHFCDLKTRKEHRKSEVTKNKLMRSMLHVCMHNNLLFKYVLADSWFASKENFNFIKLDLDKDFIMALKSNRTIALTKADRQNGRFVRVDSLDLEPGSVKKVYIKSIPFQVLVCKQVFINKDGSSGTLYLISSDINLSYGQITTIYKKRWNVETFHKSLKSNVSLAKSPTKTVRTQGNHFFASIYAFFRLEMLKLKHNMNHFAMKTKIYCAALKAALDELRLLRA